MWGRWSTVAVVPVVFRVGEVDDGLQLLQAVTKVSLVSSPPSRNNREERMEVSVSGEVPARNNERSRAVKMGEKG
jgi:hypothetical protein